MIYRELGFTGIKISEIGLGCEGFIGKDEAFTNEMFQAALEHGRSRISRLFNKNVVCSIPEYINTLRSRAAANMLLENGATITDVAMEAGFESMRTYYRSFKNCFGVTPSRFLQLSQNEVHTLIEK